MLAGRGEVLPCIEGPFIPPPLDSGNTLRKRKFFDFMNFSSLLILLYKGMFPWW